MSCLCDVMMGELTTLSAHLDAVFQRLASPALKQAAPLIGCENAVTKVRRMLLRIHAVLADAEERLLRAREDAVAAWFRSLRDAACDADDLFDEMSTRVHQLSADSAVAHELQGFDFARRVEEIAERFDGVAKRGAELNLNEVVGRCKEADANGMEIGPLVEEDGRVFGRDKEREGIIDALLSNEAKRRDFVTIPVVGTSGIGKTILAQLVFNDRRVEGHFKMRIWVSVSRDFDARRLMKAIIERASGDKYLLLGVEAMQRHLRQILGGKRYLLVMDDVREENCAGWEMVKAALLSGAKGSKALLTTTSESVAHAMGTRPAIHLKGLPFEDCWSLFGLYAFGSAPGDLHFDLVMVGKELVKKCRGLPLAVKALGGLLRTEKEEQRWRGLLKSQIWKTQDDTNVSYPVLKLSFFNLPMHLKQCFLYCSIFPRNAKFGKERLVKLWMAQGFVVPKGGERPEDLGTQYFDELLWRSFFQFLHLDKEDGEPRYTVHEVIHDFARYLSGNECVSLECDDFDDLARDARHVSLACNKIDSLSLEAFNGCHALRTFLFLGKCKLHELQVPSDYLLWMKCLRLLDLSHTSLHVLPDSIGELIHLRYLGLSSTQIESLPDSLGNLYELQSLDLEDCFELKQLSKGITKLVNLRHLDMQLHQCKVSCLLPFPSGFRQLTNLQTLSTFVVGGKDGCMMGELKGLTDLRGQLCISKLENVVGDDEANEACLRNKQYVRKLELQWSLSPKVDKTPDEKVLENLQPHDNLKELVVRGYGGTTFASWMGDPAYVNLISLNLSECLECDKLPPVGLLPSLRYLVLEKLQVKRVGQEFCGHGRKKSFPSLESLKFENLPVWEEWSGLGEDDMPCLKELYLIGCSKLKAMPSVHSSIKRLEIWNCFALTSLPKLQSVHNVVLRGPTNSLLKGLWGLTSLQHLEIKNCPELTSLSSNIKNLLSLKDLLIHDCKQLTSLPEELACLSSLESLEISGCSQLQSLPKGGVPSDLQFVNICNCPLLSVQCQKVESEDRRKLSRVFSASIDGQNILCNEDLI